MRMNLKSHCPHCQKTVKVTDALIGKRVRCPACQKAFEVTSVEATSDSKSLDRAPNANETMAAISSDNDGELDGVILGNRQTAMSSLGRFELNELLGQGAFGRVYKAYDPQLDRYVALKVPTFGHEDKHKIQRFIAEAKSAAKLRHPNIVPTYESGQIDGQYYIAAQFVAGLPLSKRVKENPPDFHQAAEWVRQLAEALTYAHGEGIVHRDIKPDNIMLDEKGVPQIMDFGLAKRLNEDAAMTTDGSILGTPAYMAPEQAKGKSAAVGPRSDQYSLGIVLYELLTGKKPFEGSPHAVIAHVIATEPPSPRSIRPEIPRDLEAICQKAIEKETSRRYPSASELADDLDRWMRGDGTLARPISLPERTVRWCRRNPTVGALTATILGVVVFSFIAISAALGVATSSWRDAVAQRNTAEIATKNANAYAAELEHERDRLQKTLQDLGAATSRADSEQERASQLLAKLKGTQGEIQRAEERKKVADEAVQATERKVKDVEEQLANAKATTEAESRRAQHLLGQSYLDLGLQRCKEGKVAEGALWLARSLETIPTEAKDIDETIRGNLSYYLGTAEESDQHHAPQLLRVMEHTRPITAAALRADGDLLVTGDNSGELHLWDSIGGTRLLSRPVHKDGKPVRSVVFNPVDGGTFATAAGDVVTMWRIDDQRSIRAFEPEMIHRSVTALAWSPDGKWILTGSDQSYQAQLWNTTTRRAVPPAIGDERTKGRVYSLAFVPSVDSRSPARRLALVGTGLLKPAVWLWDATDRTTASGRPPIPLSGDVRVVALGPRGDVALVGTQDKKAFIIDMATWAKAGGTMELQGAVTAAAFSPDQRTVLIGCDDRTAQLWDYRTGLPLGDVLPHGGPVTAVGFSRGGDTFLTASEDKKALLWAIPREGKRKIKLDKAIQALALSPDGTRVLIASERDLELWHTQSGKPLAEIRDRTESVHSLAFAPDGKTFLVGGLESARLWNTGTLMPADARMMPHDDRVIAVTYSHNGRVLATASADRRAKVWTYATQQPIGQAFEHPQRVTSVALDAEGKVLATGCADQYVRIWHVGEPDRPLHVFATGGTVDSVAFSGDGRIVAAGCDHGAALAWDIDRGEPLGAAVELAGAVRSVSFLPRTRLLATASRAGVGVWDTFSCKEVGRTLDTQAQVNFLGISADGCTIAAATSDNSGSALHVWKVPPLLHGSIASIVAWVQIRTGLQLTEAGSVAQLSPAQRAAAEQRLADAKEIGN